MIIKENKKLLIVTNVDWFFISHRLCIAEEALKKGWEVYVACEDTGRKNEIEDKGIHFIDFRFSRSGTNLFQEISTINKMFGLYRKINPDVLHNITLKPVIYGSVIARLFRSKGVVNAISGLGYNFTGERIGKVQKIMIFLMRVGFKKNNMAVIFQNDDDKNELLGLKILNKSNKIYKIKGSGVDLEKFVSSPMKNFDIIKILFPSRMLWDKGVKELKEATDILKQKYKDKIQFILSGLADTENKAGVSEEFLKQWADGEYVKWIGYQRDMVEVYDNSHIVVLPSYREGMPKTLLEACSMGKAIITTDAIGCKECVDEGINGYKVPIYDSKKLALAIEKLANDEMKITQMGINSRIKAEKEFDVKGVIKKHLEIYEFLLEK